MARGGSSAILNLETKLKAFSKALTNLVAQETGRRENWAGKWDDCLNCHKPFADWSSPGKSGFCPFCEAKQTLKEHL